MATTAKAVAKKKVPAKKAPAKTSVTRKPTAKKGTKVVAQQFSLFLVDNTGRDKKEIIEAVKKLVASYGPVITTWQYRVNGRTYSESNWDTEKNCPRDVEAHLGAPVPSRTIVEQKHTAANTREPLKSPVRPTLDRRTHAGKVATAKPVVEEIDDDELGDLSEFDEWMDSGASMTDLDAAAEAAEKKIVRNVSRKTKIRRKR